MQIIKILCQFLRIKLSNLLFIRKKRTLTILIKKEKFCKLVCRLYLRSYMYDALKMDKNFRIILIRLNEAINVKNENEKLLAFLIFHSLDRNF